MCFFVLHSRDILILLLQEYIRHVFLLLVTCSIEIETVIEHTYMYIYVFIHLHIEVHVWYMVYS